MSKAQNECFIFKIKSPVSIFFTISEKEGETEENFLFIFPPPSTNRLIGSEFHKIETGKRMRKC